MSVEIITTWYNEEFLAPFFLRHYAYADRITLLYDRDTTDNTLAIASSYPNVHVVPFRFPDMFDSGLKQVQMYQQYKASSCDWVVMVDSDEFIFYKQDGEFRYDLRPVLDSGAADIYAVRLFNVFRQHDDADLDPDLPAVPQRRHGNDYGIKPCVARTRKALYWKVGCHEIMRNDPGLTIAHDVLLGSHWALADPCFSTERRIKNRRARLSKNNRERGMGIHYSTITLKSEAELLESQLHAPQVF